VSELTDKHKDIIQFAIVEMEKKYKEGHKERYLRAENFTSQVVAGALFKFELVFKTKDTNSEEKCSIAVWEKSWENFCEVQWDQHAWL